MLGVLALEKQRQLFESSELSMNKKTEREKLYSQICLKLFANDRSQTPKDQSQTLALNSQ